MSVISSDLICLEHLSVFMGPAPPSPHFKLNLDPSWTPEPLLLCRIQHRRSHSIKKPPRHPDSTGSSPPEFWETAACWRLERGRGEALWEQTWDLGPNLQIIFDIYKVSLDDFFTLQRWAQLQRTLGGGISPGSYFCPSAEERCPNSCFNPRAGSGGRTEQPIGVTWPTKRSSLIDSGVDSGPTAACPALYRYIPTLQRSVYLVGGGPLGLSDMRTLRCWGVWVVFFVEPSLSKEAGCESLLQL